jgi:hypothetical protein
MGFLSVCFILIPFLPGVRDIPRWVPIYRLIWRDHYRDQQGAAAGKPPGASGGGGGPPPNPAPPAGAAAT